MDKRTGTAKIRFDATLYTIDEWTVLRLPEKASGKLPSRGQVAVQGTINGRGFQSVLEPDGELGHWMKVDEELQATAGVGAGVTANLELDPRADWPEPDVPPDLDAALAAAPKDIQAIWSDITPMARWEWVRWVNATRNPETRTRRVEVSISKMQNGKRRPCCFNLASGVIMPGEQLYDTIGTTYTVTRRTDPGIAEQIWAALGDARTVVNVGAGTGSYEPPGRDLTAVEPSAVMRAQRPGGAARCVAAVAEHLPFDDQSFDAAMAISTLHHWQNPIAGLREMRRVARRVVVFAVYGSSTGWHRRFWLTRDYLPEVVDLLAGFPSLTELSGAIGARTQPVLIPWDCADGFYEAHWRRPEAYLDECVRRGVSVWTKVGPDAEQRAVRSLREDLASGRWAERNRDLLELDAAELGLRLLVA
jgi:SAM-dependent methyltransferase